jgi:sugar lactone lactonase YvrE
VVASTDGFCLGLAFNHHADLFVCDLKHAAVFRLDTRRGDLERFADGVPGHRFRNPNWPAFDHLGRLYVSDSWSPAEPGPGIVRLNPDGTGELWHAGPFRFANGIAFDADCRRLYVAETHRSTVSAVPAAAIRAHYEHILRVNRHTFHLWSNVVVGLSDDLHSGRVSAYFLAMLERDQGPPRAVGGLLVDDVTKTDAWRIRARSTTFEFTTQLTPAEQ